MSRMPALHVRDVPEDTVAALKRRAALHGHSVQQELRDILDRAAAEPVRARVPRTVELQTVSTGRSGTFDRTTFYDNELAAG